MAGREHKTITIDPRRILRIISESMSKENGSNLSRTKWKADMARGSRLNRIHSETASLGGGPRENFSV
jgi:hypothetical protein